MNYGHSKLMTGFILFFALSLSFLIIQYVKTAALFYIGLLGFLLCLYLSYVFKTSHFWKAALFNLGIIMLLGGLTEAYFTWIRTSVIREGDIQTKEESLQGGDYYVTDAVRGYTAGVNVKKRVKKIYKNKVIYDVIYTTNRNGLRISPHDIAGSVKEQNIKYVNVVFFGGSFTFGEGLNDNESLPFLFEEFSGGRYKVYNFGFHGYGTHQMLRIIETGLLEKIVPDQEPLVVVYEALLQHIDRASGKLIWDAKVPRYRMSSSGKAEYAGTFVDDPDLKKNLEFSKSLSNPRSRLLAETGITRSIGDNRTAEDKKLFVQMVVQAKNLVEERHGAKFCVLVWPLGDKDTEEVIASLKARGVEIIRVDKIFKEYKDPVEKYMIPIDNHPTKLANERIARYLLNYLH